VSNTNDYIITTLSSGSTEYTNLSNAAIQAPFSLGIPTARTLRSTGAPYVSTLGNPSNIFTREVITPSGGGGGGGIPASITARDNLLHWWKLSDGSATTGTDYGLSASAGVSDLTLSGVTTDAAGPSENGTPAAISFDGVNDSANVKLVDSGGTNTAVGELVDSGGDWSISFWIKDESSSFTLFDTWFQGSTTSGLGTDGFGVWGSSTSPFWWIKAYNAYRQSIAALPTGGWLHVTITYPVPSASSRDMIIYYDGSQVGLVNFSDVSVTTEIASTADARLAFGCIMHPNGTTSNHTSPTLSDIRLYNKVLSGAEISAIAAGDWT
jgi:hypothetical protein